MVIFRRIAKRLTLLNIAQVHNERFMNEKLEKPKPELLALPAEVQNIIFQKLDEKAKAQLSKASYDTYQMVHQQKLLSEKLELVDQYKELRDEPLQNPSKVAKSQKDFKLNTLLKKIDEKDKLRKKPLKIGSKKVVESNIFFQVTTAMFSTLPAEGMLNAAGASIKATVNFFLVIGAIGGLIGGGVIGAPAGGLGILLGIIVGGVLGGIAGVTVGAVLISLIAASLILLTAAAYLIATPFAVAFDLVTNIIDIVGSGFIWIYQAYKNYQFEKSNVALQAEKTEIIPITNPKINLDAPAAGVAPLKHNSYASVTTISKTLQETASDVPKISEFRPQSQASAESQAETNVLKK